jgi:hypothetical protein
VAAGKPLIGVAGPFEDRGDRRLGSEIGDEG